MYYIWNILNNLLLGSEFLPVFTSIRTRSTRISAQNNCPVKSDYARGFPKSDSCHSSNAITCVNSENCDAEKYKCDNALSSSLFYKSGFKHNIDIKDSKIVSRVPNTAGAIVPNIREEACYSSSSDPQHSCQALDSSNINHSDKLLTTVSSGDTATRCSIGCIFTEGTQSKVSAGFQHPSTDKERSFQPSVESPSVTAAVSSGDSTTRVSLLPPTTATSGDPNSHSIEKDSISKDCISITATCKLAVLQCRKCGAAFLEAQSALAHFKLHLLVTYKRFFCIVWGKNCIASNCSVRFSCSYSKENKPCTSTTKAYSEILIPAVDSKDIASTSAAVETDCGSLTKSHLNKQNISSDNDTTSNLLSENKTPIDNNSGGVSISSSIDFVKPKDLLNNQSSGTNQFSKSDSTCSSFRQTRSSSRNKSICNSKSIKSKGHKKGNKRIKLEPDKGAISNCIEENINIKPIITTQPTQNTSTDSSSSSSACKEESSTENLSLSTVVCNSTSSEIDTVNVISDTKEKCILRDSAAHAKQSSETPIKDTVNSTSKTIQSAPPLARLDQVHFHCNFCSFTSTEVFALPVHMESEHLNFSREVTMRLQAHPQQLHREYRCGECGLKVQGTVSVIQHLLTHNSDNDPYFYKVNKSSDLCNSSLPSESVRKHTSVLNNTNNKVSTLSSGFTDLPSSLSELANKSATPLLSENLSRTSAKRTTTQHEKRLDDLKKWCPEMVSSVTKSSSVLSKEESSVTEQTIKDCDNHHYKKEEEENNTSDESKGAASNDKSEQNFDDTSHPNEINKGGTEHTVNGDITSSGDSSTKSEEDSSAVVSSCKGDEKPPTLDVLSYKKDIFSDKDIELINVRWITEGLLVDGKDGKGWKIVTSNRIVLDDPIDPLYKVDNQSCWRNKWCKTSEDSRFKLKKDETKPYQGWTNLRGDDLNNKREILPFIDGSSGFANGMATSLADIHRSIGSGSFLSNFNSDGVNVPLNGRHLEEYEEDANIEGSTGSVSSDPADKQETKSSSEINSLGVDMMQIEIDPLTLLANAIEEDQKSSNPVIPTEHFLLGKSSGDEGVVDDDGEAMSGYDDEDLLATGDAAVLGYATGPQAYGGNHALGYHGSQVMSNYGEGSINADMMQQMSNFADSAGVFQCDVCPKAFKYQYLLLSHRRQVHSIVTKPTSQQLGKLPGQKPYYMQQPSSETYNGMLGGIADDVFSNGCLSEGLDVNNVHPSLMSKINKGLVINGQLFCSICGKKFVDRASLKAHTILHTEKNNRCKSCMKEFASKSELTMHIVKYQGTCDPNKSGNIKCATCGEQLASLAALKEHRRASHPTPEQVLQQQELEASASLGDGGDLGGADPSTMVTPRRGFQCDYCGKNFNCRSNLRDHLVVHTGEKPYPCDICGKTFSFVHNMKTHRLTHNQGRQELCPYCDKSYKSKISLYYHMKKGNCRGLSTTEVPEGYHRCPDCLQMFASEERFSSHKEKGHCHASHRCPQCGLRCSSQARLDNHLEKGLCKKDPKFLLNPPQKRRRKDKPSFLSSSSSVVRSSSVPSTDDIVCERCNYTRDCCCTFNCPACGKRVFSILAYTHHKQKTCPVVRFRRDKIRKALIEKRKKMEADGVEKDGEKTPSGASNNKAKGDGSDSDDEVINFSLSDFSNLGSSILGYDAAVSSSSSSVKDAAKSASEDDVKSGWLNTDIMEGTKSWAENEKPSSTLSESKHSSTVAHTFKPIHHSKSSLVSGSKPNKTLTKLKNKAAKMARQNNLRMVLKKTSSDTNSGITTQSVKTTDSMLSSKSTISDSTSVHSKEQATKSVSSPSLSSPTSSSPAQPASTDLMSASGRRIKRPKKLESNAYDQEDECLPPPVPKVSSQARLLHSSGNVGVRSIKMSRVDSGKVIHLSQLKNVSKLDVNKTLSNASDFKNKIITTSTKTLLGSTISVSDTNNIITTTVSNIKNSNNPTVSSVTPNTTASSLIAANPGKIITLSTSALTRTKQLFSIKPSIAGHKVPGARLVTIANPQSVGDASSNVVGGIVAAPGATLVSTQTPFIVNPNNKIIVRHGTQGMTVVSRAALSASGSANTATVMPSSSGVGQTVLIPAQSFVLHTPLTSVSTDRTHAAVNTAGAPALSATILQQPSNMQ